MRFILCYIFIGIIGFFTVTLGGSHMTERHLEETWSAAMYREAHSIASNSVVKNNLSVSTVNVLRTNLTTTASFQNSIIWIINSKGEIILSTRKDIPTDEPIPIAEFDMATWGNNYYQTGDFYGYFPDQQLSVVAPITSDMKIRGYVAIHYPMENIYTDRSRSLSIMYTLFFFLYILSYLLVLVYMRHVRVPLNKIIDGASEYASGNLSYRIPVRTDDELGYLANTLNYMSEELNKNGEFQRNFISNVSHDFRSPLTSIKGYAVAMQDGTIPPEMHEKYLNIISSEADRLEKLTRSLLTLNDLDIRKRMMHMQRFDINNTIKNTAAVFEGTCIEKKILLELLLCGRELYVNADMEQIQQVLYNLLDNAIKFSPYRSTVIIETSVKNGTVFVSVKDHGTGIAREHLPRIWDRFYKTDSSRGKDRKGTGLGLAIVREIINAHQQTIDVISTEGVGTEFIFTLEEAAE